jgi:hypothetical protein
MSLLERHYGWTRSDEAQCPDVVFDCAGVEAFVVDTKTAGKTGARISSASELEGLQSRCEQTAPSKPSAASPASPRHGLQLPLGVCVLPPTDSGAAAAGCGFPSAAPDSNWAFRDTVRFPWHAAAAAPHAFCSEHADPTPTGLGAGDAARDDGGEVLAFEPALVHKVIPAFAVSKRFVY